MLSHLCIRTRAGHPGDTQNARTYVTKCWRNDDAVEESEWVGMECRDGGVGDRRQRKQCKKNKQTNKKANGRWGEKRQTVPQYVQRLLRLCASKGYKKHKHCQHAWPVEANSQNSCTAMAPKHIHTHTQLHVYGAQACCLTLPGGQYLTPSAQTETRTVDGDVTATVQTSHDNTHTHTQIKHTAHTVGGIRRKENPQRCVKFHGKHYVFKITVQEATTLFIFLINAIIKTIRTHTAAVQRVDSAPFWWRFLCKMLCI